MCNAKQEFIDATKDEGKIICAVVSFGEIFRFIPRQKQKIDIFYLKKDYTQEDFEQFLSSLDFEYDDGYGGQELFGTIWLENGVWFDRGEYDGSEWWERHEYPKIIPELLESQDWEVEANDLKRKEQMEAEDGTRL